MASAVVAPAVLAAVPRRARVACRAAATTTVMAKNKSAVGLGGVVARGGLSASALRRRTAPVSAHRGASVIVAASGDDKEEVSITNERTLSPRLSCTTTHVQPRILSPKTNNTR